MRHPALLLLAVALAACGTPDDPTPSDPADTVRVATGERFRLVLRSNQSTGFEWMLVDSAGMGPLRHEGTRYEVPRRLRGRGGAGGTETWTFAALAPGEGTVTLVYRRPWEDRPPTERAQFRVVVE